MSFVTTTVANGQAVANNDIALQSILLTAAGADSTASIYANGVLAVKVAAKAGESYSWPDAMGSNEFTVRLQGPITMDLTGAGSFARIQL